MPRGMPRGARRAATPTRATLVVLVVAVALAARASDGALVRARTARATSARATERGDAFETTYDARAMDDGVVAVVGARDGDRTRDRGVGARARTSAAIGTRDEDEEDDEAELALVRRGRFGDDGDARRDALRRVRGEGDGKRRGTFAPNARVRADAVRRAIEESDGARRVFASVECEDELASVDGMETIVYARDPLRAYLDAREGAAGGRLRAVVATCGDDARGAGEAFANDLETVEREGIAAVGVFYESAGASALECGEVEDGATGRALLALEQSEAPECGALCETQAQLVMGVIIFWGLLITLMYGWGLMTDLDTPQYWATPDEHDKQD